MGGETYAAKVFVQELHVSVDQLHDELIVLALDGTAEVEAGRSEDVGHRRDGWLGVLPLLRDPGILCPNLPFPHS